MIGLPMVLYLIVLVLIRIYPLDRAAMDQIQSDIATKKSKSN